MSIIGQYPGWVRVIAAGIWFVLPRVFAPEKIPNENEIKNDGIGSCGAACAGSLVLALQAVAVVA
jgi:hypothetical protein